MFMVLSVKHETILTPSLVLFYVFVIKDLYFFSSILPPTISLKHNYDHVICLLTKPVSSLLPKEQRANSQQSKFGPSLSLRSPFPVTLPHVTSTRTTLLTSPIPKLGELQAPSAYHRVRSLGRVTNSFPSFTAWLKCHLLYKFYPTSSGRFNCSPFGSLTFCMSLHY